MSTEFHRPGDVQRERIAYRRQRAIRSVLLAALSTAVVGTLLGVLVTGAPGWPRVKRSFLDPNVALEFFPQILEGLWLNLRMLIFCAVAALALGLLVAVLRTLRGPVFFPLRALATGYVDLFRGVPLLIALYLIGFGLPALRLQGVEPGVHGCQHRPLKAILTSTVLRISRAGTPA